MSLDGFEQELIDYIRKEVNPKVSRLDSSTDLISEDVVDSLGILSIIGFVESRYGIEIEPDEVSVDNFRSISAVRDLVRAKLAA